MPSLWTYPWTLEIESVEAACEEIADHGFDAVTLSSHYHSVRSMHPRSPGDLFRQYPGGCHFTPADGHFDATPLAPPVVDIEGFEDPFGEVVDVARDHGLSVSAWTVCLHNLRLGASNSAYRIESAFGDAHDHAPCPSHPEVREYYAAVVEAAVSRSANEVHLESVGFPSAFHPHGREFGHDKRQTLTDPVETALLSQCFCDGCRAAAEDHPVDFRRASDRVRSLLEPSLADPRAEPPSLDALVREDDVFADLFDFRAAVVEQFLERLAAAAGSTPLNYYVGESLGGVNPGELWPAGVELERLDRYLDRVTALCYVNDPAVARDRARSLAREVDATVDAGVTLDPDVVEERSELCALVDALEEVVDGRLSVYHHGLMTARQLEWVETALSE